jgi:DNA (cytosine-5)-methyltransferase 1
VVVRGPDVLWGGDIRRFHPPPGRFDGIIGGPPCQMFSPLAQLVKANGHTTRFGNLIPEFERCVSESQPAWFLMENVPQAPSPVIEGYEITPFLLDNASILGEGGFGQEQTRVRLFNFGMRGRRAPNLLRWVDLATFLLPEALPTVTSNVGGFVQKKMRYGSVTGGKGGSGKLRIRAARSNGGKGRYRIPDACRLQGLPEDFLDDAPFTAEGKLKAVANGVPIPMGRAIARAVREACRV